MSLDILNQIDRWPETAQQHLLALRALFHEVAQDAGIGPLDESLKWGQPSWRPRKARMGTTLRLNWSPDAPAHLAAYVDCKTDLASQMSTRFPGQFHYAGRRAMSFALAQPMPEAALRQLALLTFTYHRAKRSA